MSIITKALFRKRKTNDRSTVHASDKSSPSESFENYDSSNSAISEDTLESIRASLTNDHVDIPVNQVLTDEHGVIEGGSVNRSNEIDFDLSMEGDEEAMFVDAPVVAINPVQSFSNHIQLDLRALNRQGYITPDNADTLLSNTFRMIKRPLIKNINGQGATVLPNANLVMISSSLSGEGKTYSAINLALSMAMEKDKSVLLIDADVNKPSHHEVFGQSMGNGLTDYLIGKEKDMSKILYKTNIPSLSLMFAGNQTKHATELLSSDAMVDFVDEISSRYSDRIIVFDSPPLLLTTESSALSSHMGQVVLVVEAERTLKHNVRNSLDLLSNEIVLLMLNKIREKSEVGQYGYYGYGHRS